MAHARDFSCNRLISSVSLFANCEGDSLGLAKHNLDCDMRLNGPADSQNIYQPAAPNFKKQWTTAR
jgi:hypothetical protein